MNNQIQDRPLENPVKIGYEAVQQFPELGFNANWWHYEQWQQFIDDYVQSTEGSTKTFRNPSTGSNQTCYLISEPAVSQSGGIKVFNRIYSPVFSDIVHGGSADVPKFDWHGLNSSSNWGVSFDSKTLSIYSARKAITAVGDVEEVQVIDSADVVAEVGGTIDWDGTTSDLTQSADDIESDLAAASITGVFKSSSKVVIQTSLSTLSTITIEVTGLAANVTYTVDTVDAASASYAIIIFMASRAIVAGTLHLYDDGPSMASNFSSGVDGWNAYKVIHSGNYDGISDGTTLYDDVLRTYCEADNTEHYISKALPGGVSYGTLSVVYYIPPGNTNVKGLRVAGYPPYCVLQNTFGSWQSVNIVGYFQTVVTVHFTTADGSITFAGAGSPSNDLVYFAAINFTPSLEIDLSQSVSNIVSTGIDSLIKSGTKYLSTFNVGVISTQSMEVTGVPEYITHELTVADASGASTALIEFTDTRAVAQTYSNQSAVRKLTVPGHGRSQGDDCAIFNGDKLLAATYVVDVVDVDNIYVLVGFLNGKDNTATHIGDNSSRTQYATTTANVPIRITKSFYINVLTPFASIPVSLGDDSPQAHLDAVVNSTTWLQVSGARVSQIAPGMYMREVVEALTASVFTAL